MTLQKKKIEKYDYNKIRKAGLKLPFPCLGGISCNLCQIVSPKSFNKCLYESEFASDKELEKLGLIDG